MRTGRSRRRRMLSLRSGLRPSLRLSMRVPLTRFSQTRWYKDREGVSTHTTLPTTSPPLTQAATTRLFLCGVVWCKPSSEHSIPARWCSPSELVSIGCKKHVSGPGIRLGQRRDAPLQSLPHAGSTPQFEPGQRVVESGTLGSENARGFNPTAP